MKGRYLKFIIVGVAICYAATIYSRDLMQTMRVRAQKTREILGPEFGQKPPREEAPSPEVQTERTPRYLPPGPMRPDLRPKNPVHRPYSPSDAAQYLLGERMEARVQGTLFLHQMRQNAIPTLKSLFHSGKWRARAAAATAMGWIEAPSAPADMAKLVVDPEPGVRKAVADVLRLYEGPEVVGMLKRLAADPDVRVRAAAAESLGSVGDSEGIETLNPLLEDQDENVRAQAALALRRIWSPGEEPGGKGQQEVSSLVSPEVREASLKGLVKRLETDPSVQVRGYASEALGGVGDPSALDVLIERLGDKKESELVQYGAALAIGRLGGGSKAAELALRRAQIENSSPFVNKGVYDALRKLRLTPAARPGEG